MSEQIPDPENDTIDSKDITESADSIQDSPHSDYVIPEIQDGDEHRRLSGMYRNWFLDYASYVNLERAIPHINDGLKPVQRRVLHAMKRLDDGRYNKVANIVGHTMQFHPHGDASIGDALVNIGQKNLLVDTQGNWGNILTGDSAAAPRYIEARLTKFALEAVFNPKTTEWKPSYDGRNKEPISLPVKFPLLLAQGSEGIGLGLNSRILPHNFNELIDASIAVLRNEPFELYPDFPTGGMVDVSKYNDGERGGRVKIRARIEKVDNKTLAITEIPYGTTTSKVIETILKANEKGKINIKKVDDNTSANVEILVYLESKTSSDKTIDALYAFTACEVSYSPNCCVIDNNKPQFITVSEVLRRNTQNTVSLLKQELQIERGELIEQLHYASLEKIFIEERIYKDKEFENAVDNDAALDHIDLRLEPFKKDFVRELNRDDLLKLLEIRMARILKFNSDKAAERILALHEQIKDVDYKIEHIIEHTINWFTHLRQQYGGDKIPRLTEIRSFETIQASKVVEANEKLYINRVEGFIGTGLKKDEYVCNCSDIDDVILFFKDGKYKVVKVSEKLYVGKNILHVAVFIKNDKRTIYNAIYRDGRNGAYYIKRFAVYGVTRDKEYDLTQGTDGSKVVYFTANPNGEAETIKVALKPTTRRIRNLVFEKDFSDIAIKGRQSMGNILTKFDVHKILLKQKGGSTLGGTEIWFDRDVLRLNMDKRGECLGEFSNGDQILVITQSGDFYTTNYDLNNHYEDDLLRIEKLDPHKRWSLAFYDAEQGYYYIKRFQLESSPKRQTLLCGNQFSRLMLLSDTYYPCFEVIFGDADSYRESLKIDVDEFIGIKSYKAKGKRISTYKVEQINELDPIREPEITETISMAGTYLATDETSGDVDVEDVEHESLSANSGTPQNADLDHKESEDDDASNELDEITGQMRLF